MSGKVIDLTKVASNNGKGISLFTDESQTKYKDLVQYFGEIVDVMDEMSAKNKQELLELLFGKQRANAGAALLTNYKQVYRVIDSIKESTGSAEREMATMAESINYKINQFKETITGLGKTLFSQDFLKNAVKTGTSFVGILDKIIQKIGILPTLLNGLFISRFFKNKGIFSVVDNGLTTVFTKTQNISNGFELASNKVNRFVDGFNRLNSAQNFGIRWQDFFNGVTNANVDMATYFAKLKEQGASAKASIQGVYGAILDGNTKGISNVKSIISTYKQISSVSPANQQAFANAVNQTNSSLGSYLLNLNGAKASLAGYALSVAKTTAKQIALRTATIALNTVISSALITGISLLLNKISDLIVTQKEAEENAKNLRATALSNAENLQTETNQIDDLVDKYTKYITTTADLSTKKDELTEVQTQLNNSFEDEKSGIDLLNKSYAENIKLINEKKKAEAEKYVRENQRAYDEAKNFLSSEGKLVAAKNGLINNPDKRVGDKNTSVLKATGIGGWSEKTQSNWNSLGFDNIYIDGNYAYITGTVEEQLRTLKAVYESYKDQIDGLTDDKYKDRLDAINKVLSELETKYNESTKIIEEQDRQTKFIQDVAFFEDSDKNNQYQNLTEQLSELNTQFEETTSTVSKLSLAKKIKTTREELNKLVAGNDIAKESVENLFSNLNSNINQYISSISSSADTYVSDFKDYTENKLKTATENIDKFKTALQSLNDDGYISADSMWELISLDDDLSSSFTKVADGFRISSDKIIESKDDLIKKELEYAESEKQASKEIISNLEIRLKALQKEKQVAKDYLQSNGANSAWDVERINRYDYEIKQIEDSISEVKDTAQKWNLATIQIRSNLGDTVSIVDKLESESKAIESNIDKLQNKIDSINNDIDDLKDKQEELLDYYEYQVDKIVDSLEDEQKILEDEKASLESQLEILENQKSEIEEQISLYENIVSTIEDAISDEKASIEEEKTLIEAEKEELQKQLDILEGKKSAIEDSISDYEKIYSVVSDIIDKEVESIETERDAVESYYDDMISKLQEENDERERAIELSEKEAALENAKRNKVRIYNEQKGWVWSDNTSEIQKAQQELDSLRNQIKREELEKEKDQKLKEFDDKISAIKQYGEQFSQGQQEYESEQAIRLAEKILGMSREEIQNKIANQDSDFVKQINEAYSQIQETRDNDIQSEIDYINQQIDEKDNQIKIYEEMADEWDKYIEKWQNTVKEYKTAQDKLIAEQKLGSDWLEKIKRKDTSILNEFKNNYNSYQQQLNGSINQEIEDLKNSIQAKSDEIESKQRQIEEWNTYKDELRQYAEDVSRTWSDYVTGLWNISDGENDTYINRCKNLTDFKDEYLRLTSEIIDKQGELANATTELETAQATLSDVQSRLDSADNSYNEAAYNLVYQKANRYQELRGQLEYYSPMASRGDVVAAAEATSIASEMHAIEQTLSNLCEKLNINVDDVIDRFATGGVNTSTGLAWLDGTQSKPELVLNNSDTSKLYNLLHTLSLDQLQQKFHLDMLSNPPKSFGQIATNNTSLNNNRSQNIVLNFYGNIQTNDAVDFMQQMNRYIQHNKLNGRINY